MTGTSEPSAQQSGINHVPDVRGAMFRVDDVSCDSVLAVSSMRTGARTLAKRSAVVRLARRSDHRSLGRLLLPIRAGTSTLTAQGRAVHLGATADLRRSGARRSRADYCPRHTAPEVLTRRPAGARCSDGGNACRLQWGRPRPARRQDPPARRRSRSSDTRQISAGQPHGQSQWPVKLRRSRRRTTRRPCVPGCQRL